MTDQARELREALRERRALLNRVTREDFVRLDEEGNERLDLRKAKDREALGAIQALEYDSSGNARARLFGQRKWIP